MKLAIPVMAFIGCALLLSFIPAEESPPAAAPEHGKGFAWNQDEFWRSLEASYASARKSDCNDSATSISRGLSVLAEGTADVSGKNLEPDDSAFHSLEADLFTLGPHVAACPDFMAAYLEQYMRMREVLKQQSRGWDVNDRRTRDRLYRSLHGGRAAVEEIMTQHPGRVDTLALGSNALSAAPSAVMHGVELQSGDILVSRGGAPTSSLIARGNDYPGNFSHVALLHIDEASREMSVVEAHIEVGVIVASAEKYLADKKLRIMVLRLRSDLPQLLTDPLLPHRAASLALDRARSGHIPYDFEMNYSDHSRLFCSEVASSVYGEYGVDLWMGISTISSEGLRRWLASFGVRYFETQEPSDLEYDPQLVVVAEWREPASLSQDRIDNAVIDAMLEGAERGDALGYPWYYLPVARLAKAYSWMLERFGHAGPVPEGMSPTAALRSQSFAQRHQHIAELVTERATRLEQEQGYPAPYWALLELAREATLETPPTTASLFQ